MSMRKTYTLALVLAVAAAGVAFRWTDGVRLNDAEIAAIVVEANAIDAELGELAQVRAQDADIRAFGRTMSRDHRSVNEQAAALVKKLGVTPAASDVSRGLRADADAFRVELEKKQGVAFDRAYIEHEVAYHRAVIAAVDSVLLPAVQNAELRRTIEAVRPALAGHLRHAEQLAGGASQ